MSARRVLLVTGDGKGKTTAALGTALRALGHGQRVLILQFLKAAASGEDQALARLPGAELRRLGLGFVPPPGDARFAAHRLAAEAGLKTAAAELASGQWDLVLLDEICLAAALKLVDEEAVRLALEGATPGTAVVLTGRQASPKLIALADTASEVRSLKHAYDAGRPAEKGIEF